MLLPKTNNATTKGMQQFQSARKRLDVQTPGGNRSVVLRTTNFGTIPDGEQSELSDSPSQQSGATFPLARA
jgi:hypothetical protein